MAVPKRKPSVSRRKIRNVFIRAEMKKNLSNYSICKHCNYVKKKHHICNNCGYYKESLIYKIV
uniref:Large ribosomal subunit protein bL32m n=1 Tax=Reclinomonas americana TaxID=48483 RepID=RM32_RECAM|nr:ribosomal protein L32 [Reclinomonas americana]O21281.1 RecName: Full=Large ribosomal subunit protein bL32m; AltName: Full=60S ribosomal protein L32, mitochondrial [Reclinomonas americana]AAD11908.1 ribosomal protein L32 [Reclinomonas americana]